MFKRRRELDQWPAAQLREHVVACFTTDPDADEVRAAVILHQDPALLPKDAPARARAEIEANGEEWKGFPEYVTFCFGFDDSDRVDIFMDGNNAVTVREWRSTPNLADASSHASEWIGEELHQFPFENIPGLYQAAFFQVITGHEHDVGLTWMWCLPPMGDFAPVRRFPPVLDTEEPSTDP